MTDPDEAFVGAMTYRGMRVSDLHTALLALSKEVEVLRQYGNKDCTAMADAALAAAGAQHVDLPLPASDGSYVRIPTSVDEAAAMVILGTDYLKRYAPHRLKQS